MKKAIIFLIIFVCTASYVLASPYLISDPQDPNEIKGYKITWDDGQTWQECGKAINPNGEIYVSQDFSGIPEGTYVVRVKSYNIWGESADSNQIVFKKKLPPLPINMRLSP